MTMTTIMIEGLTKEEKKLLNIAKARGEYDTWKEMLLDHREVKKEQDNREGTNEGSND